MDDDPKPEPEDTTAPNRFLGTRKQPRKSKHMPKMIYTNFLQINLDGDQTPCAKMAEMECNKKPQGAKARPQMWFGRTPSFLQGTVIEDRRIGTIEALTQVDASQDLLAWEERHQESLKKLVSLIDELKSLTRWTKHDGAKLRYDDDTGELGAFEMLDKCEILTEPVLRHF